MTREQIKSAVLSGTPVYVGESEFYTEGDQP